MKIYIQKNAIKYETGKAILVKNTRQKFEAWLPKSLVKETSNRKEFANEF